MKVVDLNILLYAVNQDAIQHESVRTWWESAVDDEEPVGLPWVVLLGFLRLSTSPRVFPHPLSAEQAIERVDAWLSHPRTKILLESEEQWGILRNLLERTGTAGNLTTDAHLASLAIAYGATLVSCDAEFGRFQQLRWLNPLAE
jgi:hypothetical protein